MNWRRSKKKSRLRGSPAFGKRRPTFALALLLTLILLVNLSAPMVIGNAATPDPLDPLVNALFARITVEQRIGQLMLVTFRDKEFSADSSIARLIHDNRIGGVLLLPGDGVHYDDPAGSIQALTNQLQQLNRDATLNESGRQVGPYIPLFIAATDDGSSAFSTRILAGMTNLPSNMALGASWDPDHARQVGSIAGRELSALGVNLWLGPALDVIAAPSADNVSILGTHSFGGEPWWVSKIARSYVKGLHEGSGGRLAVAPRDFPGLGSSDRRPDQEIPVVPRTADELGRIDLVPFFAVTGQSEEPLEKADGLQCASLRYQGINIRTVTRPTCIDEQAFADVMRMEGFGSWRNDGGMVLSDVLGTRALRRWYNTTIFPHRQVAREALLAGNDMLLLQDFGPNNGDPDESNITDVIGFFTTLYRSDPVIKARIDQAVKRILKQKLKVYGGDLTITNVLRDGGLLTAVGDNGGDLFGIARDSVTLIAPSHERLAPPPVAGNNIVIFTDLRMQRQCSYCSPQPVIDVDALEKAIVRLYGPQASGQVSPTNISSFSFSQLAQSLNTGGGAEGSPAANDASQVRTALDKADWIVFSMLDVSSDAPASNVVQTFLEARPDLVSKAKVVVMAFGAPVYLSATDISKLAAYYGIYSSGDAFVDAGARALFQEVSYRGRLPLSVPAVSYDIFQATSPDPTQVIRIVPEYAAGQTNLTRTALPGLLPTTSVGDTLVLRTEPILDMNGHVVPNGTPVEFTLWFVTEGVQRRQDATTKDGIARTSFTLSRSGQIQITASSMSAATSVTFKITVAENALAATLQTIEPPTETQTHVPSPTNTATATATLTSTLTPSFTATALPTATNTRTATPLPSATHTVTASPTPTHTATQPPTATSSPSATREPTRTATAVPTLAALSPGNNLPRVGPREFIGALVGLLVIAASGFVLGWTSTRSIDGGLRVLLSCVIAGLLGYIYFAFGRLGAEYLRTSLQDFGAELVTLSTGLGGLVAGWITAWRSARLMRGG